MSNYLLFDDAHRHQLLPFTHLRPCADLLCGSFTFRERWSHFLKAIPSSLSVGYLNSAFPATYTDDNIFINGLLVANRQLLEAIQHLKPDEALVKEDKILAVRSKQAFKQTEVLTQFAAQTARITYEGLVESIDQVWELFSKNGALLCSDFPLLTQNKSSHSLEGITAVKPENIFIEAGATVGAGVILNATDGPIFIAKNAHIMDGALIRGPFTLLENAVVKMGAKIYGNTTIGVGCKVGGEVSNVIFFSNSNKGHDGYLGNSVVGSWCNLGADTNSSNLKNNYDQIKIWNEYLNKSVKTGLQFCGLLMGDHSKCSINTMFNTGTVVGISANIFGAGFPEKFIPSFSWGGAEGQTTYQFHKALETAQRVLARRNLELNEEEVKVLEHVFAITQKQRDTFSNTA